MSYVKPLIGLKHPLCFQTSKDSHGWCCLKMSRTRDMVIITPTISLENFGGEVFILKNKGIFKFTTQHVSR